MKIWKHFIERLRSWRWEANSLHIGFYQLAIIFLSTLCLPKDSGLIEPGAWQESLLYFCLSALVTLTFTSFCGMEPSDSSFIVRLILLCFRFCGFPIFVLIFIWWTENLQRDSLFHPFFFYMCEGVFAGIVLRIIVQKSCGLDDSLIHHSGITPTILAVTGSAILVAFCDTPIDFRLYHVSDERFELVVVLPICSFLTIAFAMILNINLPGRAVKIALCTFSLLSGTLACFGRSCRELLVGFSGHDVCLVPRNKRR